MTKELLLKKVYEILDEHNIEYPEGHKILITNDAYLCYIENWFEDFDDAAIHLGYGDLAIPVINIADGELHAEPHWFNERWVNEEGTMTSAFSDDYNADADNGIKRWNDYVVKTQKMKILMDKV